MTRPTPPHANNDLYLAADAIARQWGYASLTEADNAPGREGDAVRDAALAVLNALTAAGRLTTNGRCGTIATALDSLGAASRPVCALTAGHAGWHRADNGCEWGEVRDDQNPPAPHVTEWLQQAVANHTPGRPDDITRLQARADGWDVRTEYGVRLTWDNGTVEDLPRDSRRDALTTVAMHLQQRAERPGWRATAALIQRTVTTTAWTEVTTEEPQP